MNSRSKLTWTVVLVLLGLLLASTAVYALYRFFADPGLQAVSDAGLMTDVNVTAQPTILPQQAGTPTSSETKDGLTATLVSAYADAHRMSFVVHFDGWKPDYAMDLPFLEDANGVGYNAGRTNEEPSDSDPSTWTINILPFSEFQIERFNGKLRVFVDNSENPRFAEFDFNVDLPVYKLIVLEPKQSVIAHGIEIRLEKIELSPSYGSFYFSVPGPGGIVGDWSAGWPSLYIDQDATSTVLADVIPTFHLGTDAAEPPVIAGFPIGYENHAKTVTLTIPGLTPVTFADVKRTSSELKRAQEKLAARGIMVSYIESRWLEAPDGFSVEKKPAGMSDDDVKWLFYAELGLYYAGPWTFTVNLAP